MCGIVGAVSQKNVAPILIEGLKRLEYRGYDSAGLALIAENRKIERVRAVGKVSELALKLTMHPISGSIGIAHTRWATHGKPTENNAHPHMAGEHLAIVHNGIIENYAELKADLQAKGIVFSSETDTEVIAHLIAQALQHGGDLVQGVKAAISHIKGAYAIAVMHSAEPDRLIAVRHGSPLVIGLGNEENFIASDSLSLLPYTKRFIYLHEGDIAVITRFTVELSDAHGHPVTRPIEELDQQADAASKGRFKHYMLKEIYEQPDSIANTMRDALSHGVVIAECFGPNAKNLLAGIENIKIVACGTSYHAGMVAKYWLENSGISVDVEIASELRYRKSVVRPNTLFLAVSQSGETADTLAALRQAKTLGYKATMVICNVPTSSLVREADLAYLIKAGTEVGVASTKAFTAQLVAFFILNVFLNQEKGRLDIVKQLLSDLDSLSEIMREVLLLDEKIQLLAEHLIDKNHALFLGRGESYPIALEGALKLKEISYIHAEAYPAGELKHGPLALVDHQMPVIVLAPNNELIDKLKANIQEVQAREAELFIVTDNKFNQDWASSVHIISMPSTPQSIMPIVYTLPLQLLAYYVAELRGADVDQPRNLAKSVTVE